MIRIGDHLFRAHDIYHAFIQVVGSSFFIIVTTDPAGEQEHWPIYCPTRAIAEQALRDIGDAFGGWSGEEYDAV